MAKQRILMQVQYANFHSGWHWTTVKTTLLPSACRDAIDYYRTNYTNLSWRAVYTDGRRVVFENVLEWKECGF